MLENCSYSSSGQRKCLAKAFMTVVSVRIDSSHLAVYDCAGCRVRYPYCFKHLQKVYKMADSHRILSQLGPHEPRCLKKETCIYPAMTLIIFLRQFLSSPIMVE